MVADSPESLRAEFIRKTVQKYTPPQRRPEIPPQRPEWTV
jgi:hypothetical protein